MCFSFWCSDTFQGSDDDHFLYFYECSLFFFSNSGSMYNVIQYSFIFINGIIISISYTVSEHIDEWSIKWNKIISSFFLLPSYHISWKPWLLSSWSPCWRILGIWKIATFSVYSKKHLLEIQNESDWFDFNRIIPYNIRGDSRWLCILNEFYWQIWTY